jgi:dipeptidyl aminopeptidase/acylaminoacyl peptidase
MFGPSHHDGPEFIFVSLMLEANHRAAMRRLWPEGAWPCFSPDGRQLVFTGHLDRRNCSLMLLSVERGGEPQVITPSNIDAKRPAWLANSLEIVFNRDQRALWTLDMETELLAPFLPGLPADIPAYLHPCAYPNERAVVVVSQFETEIGRAAVLFKLAPGTADPVTQLTRFPQVCAGRPAVSPDGKTVVFAGNAGQFDQGANQLWVVRADGDSRRLEKGEPALVQGRAPRWSPDGKWIACTSTRPATNPTEDTPRAVWIVAADGEQAYQLTDCALDALHVAWSPNQKLLACGGSNFGLTILELPECFQGATPVGPDAAPVSHEHVP